MSYLVIARKYRPQNFLSVSGQEHVTRTLANSIKRDKVAHAYLFAGPRGVGKTSIARIFSKALNCKNGPTSEPCGECSNCTEIAQGTSLAVREIDGASHNSVDNVRELIESFRSMPAPGSRYKVYIIDEVHMLSTAAFNALLKSLEEPPPNTVFILATTEAHKIPETVISRCQRHDLRALGQGEIEKRLGQIAEAEKLEVEPGVLRLVARFAEGSMRDAQSLFDRVQSFCEGKITVSETSHVLGAVEQGLLFRLSRFILEKKAESSLAVVQEVFACGIDHSQFFKEFVCHFRDLMLMQLSPTAQQKELRLSDVEREEFLSQATIVNQRELLEVVSRAREGIDAALRSAYPRYAFEALVVQLCIRYTQETRLVGPDGGGVKGSNLNQGVVGGGAVSAAPTRPLQLTPASEAPRVSQVNVSATPVAKLVGAESMPVPSPITISPVTIESSAAKGFSPMATYGSNAQPVLREEIEFCSEPLEIVSPAKNFTWEGFVCAKHLGAVPVLIEQLKRVSVTKFESGELRGSGPEFSLGYIQKPDNIKKIQEALGRYTGISEWRIVLEKAVGASASQPTSIQKQEHDQRLRAKEQQTQGAMNHPSIKSLQKVFPGSKIESIKIKE